MLNEILGYVWWEYENEIEPEPDHYHVFVEAGKSVYRCSSSDRVWRKVDAIPNPDRFVFRLPLLSTISRCLTGHDGTLYILFTDGTAIDMLTSAKPGWVTICGEAAGFLREEHMRALMAANPDMSDTPIYTASA